MARRGGSSKASRPRSRAYCRSQPLQIRGLGSRLLLAAEDRFDDAPHALLAQFVGQLVEMHDAVQDELLLGLEDGVFLDRAVAVAAPVAPEAGPVAERVHEPGLALGLRPDPLPRLRTEGLAGLGGVLGQQCLDLGAREVAE